MLSVLCTLKRCQGKRGCICPKGKVPIGAYAGRKLEPLGHTPIIESDEPQPEALDPKPITRTQTSPKKLAPIATKKSPMKSKSAGILENVSLSPPSPLSGIPPLTAASNDAVDVEGPDGEVVIRYNHYRKSFSVTKGSTTAALIDAEYFLTFAFPKCKIHLTLFGPSDFTYEEQGLQSRPLLNESPQGTYHGINLGREYWVDIEEDHEERRAYEERQDELAKESAAKRLQEEARGEDDHCPLIKTSTESCSCIEGNPCLDRYACKDWEHRYDVAKKHGWKGFQ